MSGVTPFFITGANCKLKVNGVTIAFATNFNCSVRVPHARIRNIGGYEAGSLEPLSYDVDGSFDVIRYVDGIKSKFEKMGYSVPNDTTDLGNGIGGWDLKQISSVDGRAHESLNPSRLQDAITFDIEIYQKLDAGASRTTGITRARNARIVAVNTSINKRGVAVQSFQFMAQYLDEDSFIADPSTVI
jgi:hypothetical protein